MVAMLFFVTSDNIMVNMLINAAPAKDNPTKIKAACPTVRLNGRNRTNCSIVSYPSNPYTDRSLCFAAVILPSDIPKFSEASFIEL